MEFTVKTGQPEKQRSQCLIVGVYESRRLSPSATKLDEASGGYISKLLRSGDCDGKVGHFLLLHNVPNIAAERVLLLGCGTAGECTEKFYREIITTLFFALKNTAIAELVSFLSEINVENKTVAWKVRQFIIITRTFIYRFEELKSQKTPPMRAFKHFTLMFNVKGDATKAQQAINEGMAIAKGMEFTKDLANLPANICTPSYLAETAKKFAKRHSKIATAILEEKEMRALGMGALLSVAQGSNLPPKLITMEYRGSSKNTRPIVLVGKGITFDTGGNSLKAPTKMIAMKYDMCGAATIFGVMQAAHELNLPLNIIGVIPTCENMPGANATRPDDVVTSLSGLTIEILNTDAEGRLILADALTYSERFNPEVVIDIATLTGACVMALSSHASGLMANDQNLANALLEAGKETSDRAWQLPVWDDYFDTLKSDVADITNVSTADIGGGAIIAGCFLSKFTKKFKWAHLDVAGSACFFSGPKKGPSGRPVPLLVQYLIDCCK